MFSLLRSSLQPSTVESYSKAWDNFSKFVSGRLSQSVVLPVDVTTIGLYVTELYRVGLQASSIRTHLSAISFMHKLKNMADPTQTFFISKLMFSINKQKPTIDKRLPIGKTLLEKLIPAIDICGPTRYGSVMYKAMALLAYYACLRVGEMTYNGNVSHVLQLSNVTPVITEGVMSAFKLSFSTYKHSDSSQPVFQVTAHSSPVFCPVAHMHKYLQLRGSIPGPLFQNHDKSHVTRAQFLKSLRDALSSLRIPVEMFNTHSFRIGRCTDMANMGYSESQIKAIGRWKSNAFTRYIRPSIVSV